MITGATRVFFTLADPIDQVRAPEVFNAAFARCGVDAVMVPLCVGAADLSATVRALFASRSTGGVALSIPHKSAGALVVDRCSHRASIAGAINAIRRGDDGQLEGDLFDGLGFVSALDRHAMTYRGKRVLLIGAGGAASAIATELAANGALEIAVHDPDTKRAHALMQIVRNAFGVTTCAQPTNDPAGYELVINASPLGLHPHDPMPVPPERLEPNAQVCDILMKNQPTPLLRAAKERAMPTLPGFDMLLLQTPLYLDFFGLETAADAVRADDAALRRLIVPESLLG